MQNLLMKPYLTLAEFALPVYSTEFLKIATDLIYTIEDDLFLEMLLQRIIFIKVNLRITIFQY